MTTLTVSSLLGVELPLNGPDANARFRAGSLRNGSERDPANTRHTIEPVPLGPIGEFGWICDDPLWDGETKKRTFVVWPALADSRMAALEQRTRDSCRSEGLVFKW